MSAEVVHEHRLTLQEVVGWLIEDGMVDRAAGDKLVAERRLFKGGVHPLVLVADQEWRNLKPPEKTLTLEDLTVWLAERVGMAYVKIDPLEGRLSPSSPRSCRVPTQRGSRSCRCR